MSEAVGQVGYVPLLVKMFIEVCSQCKLYKFTKRKSGAESALIGDMFQII